MTSESSRINLQKNKTNYGAIITNPTYSSEFDDHPLPSTSYHDTNTQSDNRNKSKNISNVKKFVINYLEKRIQQIQRRNFKITQFKSNLKILRKLLHLNKHPKKKGYDKFLSDEDKRYERYFF